MSARMGSNRLAVLAADIRAAHAAIQASAETIAEQALAAGAALIEAKAVLQHGAWEPWLSEHAGMSARTARRYMQLARSGMKTATVADLGIKAAAAAIARRKRADTPMPPGFDAWAAELRKLLDSATPTFRAQMLLAALLARDRRMTRADFLDAPPAILATLIDHLRERVDLEGGDE